VSFLYSVYGIGIESDTCISGLNSLSHLDNKNLRFESGAAPEWVRDGLRLPGRVLVQRPHGEGTGDPTFVLTEHGNRKFFELSYADGTLFVADGNLQRIWGTVEPPLTMQDLATYFLGPILGFVLRQRRVTCLHASAVELQERGVLFAGDGGYGKSTTAGAFALRGFPVLCEDIAALELTTETVSVIPGYPRICLWPDSAENLVGHADALPQLTPTWEKRFLALDGIRGKFAREKRFVGLIYLLGERSSVNAPHIEEVAPKDALLELVKRTYMNWLLDPQRRGEEFDELSKVVRRIPVRRIIPHQDAARIGELCDVIVADVARVLSVRV
jgi:hypothetical protein